MQAIAQGLTFDAVRKGLKDAECRSDKLSQQLGEICVPCVTIPMLSKESVLDSLRDLTTLLTASPLLGREFISRAIIPMESRNRYVLRGQRR